MKKVYQKDMIVGEVYYPTEKKVVPLKLLLKDWDNDDLWFEQYHGFYNELFCPELNMDAVPMFLNECFYTDK